MMGEMGRQGGERERERKEGKRRRGERRQKGKSKGCNGRNKLINKGTDG